MRADSREQAMAILIPLLPRSMGADTLSPLELEEYDFFLKWVKKCRTSIFQNALNSIIHGLGVGLHQSPSASLFMIMILSVIT